MLEAINSKIIFGKLQLLTCDSSRPTDQGKDRQDYFKIEEPDVTRIIVDFDLEFDTLPFEYNHGPDAQGKVSSDLLERLLRDSKEDDFGITISSLDPEDGWFEVGILFEQSGLKKGGIFKYDIDTRKCTAHVTVKGLWQSTALRSGVKQMYAARGDDVDFRLSGFVFKKGPYSGFEGMPSQFSNEEFKKLPSITKWQMK